MRTLGLILAIATVLLSGAQTQQQHPRQTRYDPNDKTALYGGFNYEPDHDVVRAPMRVETIPFSVDQLTWGFTDVTPRGGAMRLWWHTIMASVPFKIVN